MSDLKHNFPCDYLVKIIATKDIKFPNEIISIINAETTIIKQELTLSKNEKYNSLSVTLHLQNELELEKIYLQIKDKPYIKMIL